MQALTCTECGRSSSDTIRINLCASCWRESHRQDVCSVCRQKPCSWAHMQEAEHAAMTLCFVLTVVFGYAGLYAPRRGWLVIFPIAAVWLVWAFSIKATWREYQRACEREQALRDAWEYEHALTASAHSARSDLRT